MRIPILRQDFGPVSILWLNRAVKRNAITTAMMTRLGSLLGDCLADRRIRVVLIAGKGPHFSAGGDMNEMRRMDALQSDAAMVAWQHNLELIERSTKPVIAMVQGAAYGGGTELAMACHIRVCAEGARFAQTEIALDHLPGGGGTQRLPRLVPLTLAYEHLLLGEPIAAAEAYRIGFVSHVWPDAELFDRTLDLARRIARRAPTAVRYTMEAVRLGREGSLDSGMRLERAMAALVNESREAKEGMRAFFESGRRPTRK